MKNYLKILIGTWLVLAAVVISVDDSDARRKPTTWCNAPCIVYFGQNMHEDQFCIDYRGNGTLKVWRDNDTVCR